MHLKFPLSRVKIIFANLCKSVTFASGFFQANSHRGVAQLAARHVRDVEVGSSSLLTPTNKGFINVCKSEICRHFLYVTIRPGTWSAVGGAGVQILVVGYKKE